MPDLRVVVRTEAAQRDLARIRDQAARLRAGLNARPPEQQPPLTEAERRARSSTSELWPLFRAPGA